MAIIDFFPIDVDYVTKNEKSFILIFGRTIDGKRIAVIDENYEPYFYVVPKDKTLARNLASKLEKLNFKIKERTIFVKKIDIVQKKFLGKDAAALKIFINDTRNISKVKDYIRGFGEVSQIYESDLPVYRKYLIDKKINPLLLTPVEGGEVKENYDADI
ncbi:MAG: 3'-5' exonuclease, partial [Nanoarchaeota archaeon]